MPPKNRTIVIGIDGVPFGLLDDLTEKGIMPNFAELKGGDEGVFTPMKSSIPDISSVSWSSVITGKNPGEHGIYGFTEHFFFFTKRKPVLKEKLKTAIYRYKSIYL